MSATIRNIIDTIGFMGSIELDTDSVSKNLLKCPFINEIKQAFDELGVTYVIRPYGIVLDHNGEYNIQFSYRFNSWSIRGSIMNGTGSITKYKDGGR